VAFTNFEKTPERGEGAVIDMRESEPIAMVLNRDFCLSSTLGHVITFEKDKPMSIPPIMVRACAEIGATRVDGVDSFEIVEDAKATQPVDPGIRLEQVRTAIDTVCERNTRGDFTASNTPKVAVISAEVGYKVDRTEVSKAWQIRNEELANEAR
jgi:hypothetical protein